MDNFFLYSLWLITLGAVLAFFVGRRRKRQKFDKVAVATDSPDQQG